MNDASAHEHNQQLPQVPGYDSFELIGRGGFSTVWRARQIAYDRPVAVKILNSSFDDEAGQRRFQRECALTGRLTGHPNIITVLDSGFLADGHPFLTMEYCPNGSLADRIQRSGPLPPDEVSRIGVKIAAALHTAHQRGVIHRDVKPENILITPFGEPALADFGISTSATAGTVTAAYTPTHAAPEVLLGETADARTDLYTLGSTLYQLLTGKPAFAQTERGGLARFVQDVLNAPPPSLEGLAVPEPIRATIGAAMAKDPAARPASAAAFGQMMQDAQRASGIPVTEMLVAEAGGFPTEAIAAPGTEAAPTTVPGATRVSSRRTEDLDAPPAAAVQASQATILPPSYRGAPPAAVVGDATVLGGRGERPLPDADFAEASEDRKKRRWPLILMAVIAFVLVGGVAALFATGAGQGMLGRFGVGTPADPAVVAGESPGPDATELEWPPEDEELPPEGSGSGAESGGSSGGSGAKAPATTPSVIKPTTKTPGSTPSVIKPTVKAPVSTPSVIKPSMQIPSMKPSLAKPSVVIKQPDPPKNVKIYETAENLYLVWNDSPSTSVTEYKVFDYYTKKVLANVPRSDTYRCGYSVDHCYHSKQPSTGNRCFYVAAYTSGGTASEPSKTVCSTPIQ